MSAEEEKKEVEPELYFEQMGHIRYLCVREGDMIVKERIPLHVWNMENETAKHWYYQDLTKKLKRKMFKKRGWMPK